MTRPAIDHTHDRRLSTWVASAVGHPDFPIQNLPLGRFAAEDGATRAGCAIGDKVLDLTAAVTEGLLPAAASILLLEPSLNALLADAPARLDLRHAVSRLLSVSGLEAKVAPMLHAAAACVPVLPARIGDYTDFYAGIHHAENVGKLMRPDNPLLPNYKYVPIGYHGRASSVRVSGAPVVRPSGQKRGPQDEAPAFGPSARLDFELELGLWIGAGNASGRPIPIQQAGEHLAGACLLNDWSARDLQAWEYQPLGPFLAKNFATTISPWIITREALAPFFIAQPPRPAGDPQPLDYLLDAEDQAAGALALDLEALLTTEAMRAQGLAPHRLTLSHASHMYWTPAQLVAHHASNGCDLQPGDLLGTGTISGPDAGGFGSLLEATRGGADPIALPSGEHRAFLQDGDEVTLRATARAEGFVPIGFGACIGRVEPAP